MLVARAASRRTFGKRVLEHQVIQHQIAEIRIAIDQCRLLTLNAAHLIDKYGSAKKARKEVCFFFIFYKQLAAEAQVITTGFLFRPASLIYY